MKSKQWYYIQIKQKPIEIARQCIQLVFLFFILYIGFRFFQFYLHFSTLGASPYVERPSAVEGFLPISALVALKVWVLTGDFDHIHPAGLLFGIHRTLIIYKYLFSSGDCLMVLFKTRICKQFADAFL